MFKKVFVTFLASPSGSLCSAQDTLYKAPTYRHTEAPCLVWQRVVAPPSSHATHQPEHPIPFTHQYHEEPEAAAGLPYPHEWIHFLRRFHNFHNGPSTPPSTNIIIIIIGILHPRKASLRVSSEAPGATISSRSTSSVVEVERCGRALHAQSCTQEHTLIPFLHILLHQCETSAC